MTFWARLFKKNKTKAQLEGTQPDTFITRC